MSEVVQPDAVFGATPPPPPAPDSVMPVGPVPTSIGLGASVVDGNGMVTLTFHTPIGTAIYFLSAETAEALAANLPDALRVARTGLVVARG